MEDASIEFDDYKIYVQHELIKLNNKISDLENKRFPKPLHSDNGFGAFKNDFYGFVSRFVKKNKNTDSHIEQMKLRLDILEKATISIKNKNTDDISGSINQMYTMCFISILISTTISYLMF